jgi:hypothetical protein
MVVLWASANSTARFSGICSAPTVPQKKARNTVRKIKTARRDLPGQAGFMFSSSTKVAGAGNVILNEG